MDEFILMFKEKANGIIKEKKPSTIAPRNDRGGGKFNVTIFSWERTIFQGFSYLQDTLSRLFIFTFLFVSHFQAKPSPT